MFANGPGDLGSIPGWVIAKTLKMVLDTSLLNTQQYKVRIKGKVEQSRERSSTLSYTLVKKEPFLKMHLSLHMHMKLDVQHSPKKRLLKHEFPPMSVFVIWKKNSYVKIRFEVEVYGVKLSKIVFVCLSHVSKTHRYIWVWEENNLDILCRRNVIWFNISRTKHIT